MKNVFNAQRATKTVLQRAVSPSNGEQKLIFAIITQAIDDLFSGDQSERKSAAEYFRSPGFEWHCGLIGLDQDFAREVLKVASENDGVALKVA